MSDCCRAVKITENVYWVGAIDWSLVDFHGYLTKRGSTYNAFLVMADKVTLIDTVKKPFRDEMLRRISSVVDPSRIEYIVSNHSEMDHSGCLESMISIVKPEKVFASINGQRALEAHFHGLGDGITTVKDGETLDLGNMNLTFFETKMLHWPDSMIGYLDRDRVLFSQDGFGMHLASSERFADELPWDSVHFESKKYYANILLLYASQTRKLLEKLNGLNLDVAVLAPDHGPLWRDDGIGRIIGLYSDWARGVKEDIGVVVYDTMWGSTEMMARAVADGMADSGLSVRVLSLKANHRSDIITEIMGACALAIGSPTMNNQLFPTIADLLCYMKGLKPQNLRVSAFGSYGWSGEALAMVKGTFDEMKLNFVGEGVRTIYVPTREILGKCHALGKDLGINECPAN